MSRIEKVIQKILSGRADFNIEFKDLRKVVAYYGFDERIEGSHHIFAKKGFAILINLQREKGKAKAYQVKQVRKIIQEYFQK